MLLHPPVFRKYKIYMFHMIMIILLLAETVPSSEKDGKAVSTCQYSTRICSGIPAKEFPGRNRGKSLMGSSAREVSGRNTAFLLSGKGFLLFIQIEGIPEVQ
ncbi:hypothetical protein BJP48_15640 [Paenibacillus odorifer]|nr:hypothetical protein BJP47_17745 [Paenibacillus odorifer]OMD30475.1 hypothetical protein BJP48_15640 [Paenibacillus odorifer]